MKRVLLVLIGAVALLALLAAPAFAHGKTIYVRYTGKHDYTTAIQKAFDRAVKAGPGSTVRLSAGHFYTNTVFVQGFKGTFKGAGEHKTFIDCLRGLDPNLPGITLTPDPRDPGSYVEPWCFLFGFRGGQVRVSDMTCAITASSPGVGASYDGGTYTALGPVFLITGKESAAFDRVAFIPGTNGDDNGFNFADGVGFMGKQHLTPDGFLYSVEPTTGVDSVTRCSFDGEFGVFELGLKHGTLTIGGHAAEGNTFRTPVDMVNWNYVGLAGLAFLDASGSTILVSHNTFDTDNTGVIFWTGEAASNGGALPAPPAPRYLIADNQFVGNPYAEGITVDDDSFAPANAGLPGAGVSHLDICIARNAFAFSGDGHVGAVDGSYSRGVRVFGNTISGEFVAAINVGCDAFWGNDPAPSSGWQIIGNDLSGVSPHPSGPGAQIWLGEDATHCLVVGGFAPTTVLDQGTDNILINVDKLPNPSAAAARAKALHLSMRSRKSLKEMMKRF